MYYCSRIYTANFAKKRDFDKKLKDVQSKKKKKIKWTIKKSKSNINKRINKRLDILNGTKYFSLGIFQNYLVFIPIKKYIKYFSGTTRVKSWKSKSDSNFAPTFVDHHLLHEMNFNGHCLMKIIFLSVKK